MAGSWEKKKQHRRKSLQILLVKHMEGMMATTNVAVSNAACVSFYYLVVINYSSQFDRKILGTTTYLFCTRQID